MTTGAVNFLFTGFPLCDKINAEITAAYPNAKLHIMEGGGRGFGRKHDAIAIAHLRRFAGRNEK